MYAPLQTEQETPILYKINLASWLYYWMDTAAGHPPPYTDKSGEPAKLVAVRPARVKLTRLFLPAGHPLHG
jgi:hypothetical protein